MCSVNQYFLIFYIKSYFKIFLVRSKANDDDDEYDLEDDYYRAQRQTARARIILSKKYRKISSVVNIPISKRSSGDLSEKLNLN